MTALRAAVSAALLEGGSIEELEPGKAADRLIARLDHVAVGSHHLDQCRQVHPLILGKAPRPECAISTFCRFSRYTTIACLIRGSTAALRPVGPQHQVGFSAAPTASGAFSI